MLPVSVSDILKVLEQIPVWKAVAGLPKRLAEMERRVAALEGGPKLLAPLTGKECPICGSQMKVVSELPHPQFGFSGTKLHKMHCPECGGDTDRDYTPGKGYDAS